MFTLEELQRLDPKKLVEEIEKAEKDLFKVKFEVSSGQSKSNHLITQNKAYIAQLKTTLALKKSDQPKTKAQSN
jgi:ribosomal protein L29